MALSIEASPQNIRQGQEPTPHISSDTSLRPFSLLRHHHSALRGCSPQLDPSPVHNGSTKPRPGKDCPNSVLPEYRMRLSSPNHEPFAPLRHRHRHLEVSRCAQSPQRSTVASETAYIFTAAGTLQAIAYTQSHLNLLPHYYLTSVSRYTACLKSRLPRLT